MQAAVGHEEHVAARNLPVDDAANVDAGCADEIAAELDHEPRLRQRVCAARRRDRARFAPIGARSSGSSPGKYGMPKPPPMLSTCTGAGAAAASRIASSTRLPLRLADRLRLAGSASRCRCESPRRRGRGGRSRSSSAGTTSASTPNCLGPPPIFMPDDFSSKSGLTRTATRARQAGARATDARGCSTSRADSTLTRMPAASACASSASLLAGPGEADLARRHAGVERDLELAAGGDVDAVDDARHERDERRHRIGLHRVVQLDRGGRCRRSSATPRVDQRAGRTHRTACGPTRSREPRERHAADDEAIVGDGPAGCARSAAGALKFAAPVNSAPSALRSILPLGLRGSGPGRMSMRAGTMYAGRRSRHSFSSVAASSVLVGHRRRDDDDRLPERRVRHAERRGLADERRSRRAPPRSRWGSRDSRTS